MMLLDGNPSATPIRRRRGFSGTAAAVEAHITSANSIVTIRSIELSLVRRHFFPGPHRRTERAWWAGASPAPDSAIGPPQARVATGLAALRKTALPRECVPAPAL